MFAIGKCDIGRERKQNEDARFVSDGSGRLKDLYIVADGIGGHFGGEVASSLAIETFLEYVENHYTEESEVLEVLIGGLQYANNCVYSRARLDRALTGMGTTFLAAAIRDNTLYAVHIGDSRLYLLRGGRLTQLSRDHSYVMEMVRQGKLTAEEASVHPKRNIITRALGIQETAEPDTIIEKLWEGDSLLLCSDGLSGMLSDAAMEHEMNGPGDTAHIVDRLVDEANRAGGRDNISAIVIRNRR